MTVPVRPPASAAASSRCNSAMASRRVGVASAMPGEEHPGQRDVLVLAAGTTGRRPRTGPVRAAQVECLVDVGRAGEQPCPHGGDRPHVRGEVAGVHAAGPRPEAPARRQVALGFLQWAIATRHRYGFCGSPAGSPRPGCAAGARSAASRSSRSRAIWLSPTYMSAVPGSTVHRGRRPAAERSRRWQRIAEATLGEADVCQGDRAAEDVGDVPGPLQPVDAGGVGAVGGLEVAVAPGREPGQGRGAGAGEVVAVGAARSMASRACSTVPATSPRARASAARYSSTVPGRRASSSWSATTIPATLGCRTVDTAVSSHCSTSSRRRSTSSNSPRTSALRRSRTASTVGPGRRRRGWSSTQPRMVPPAGCAAGRDGELDEGGGTVDVAGGQGVPDGWLRLAVLRRTTGWPGGAGRRPRRVARRAGASAARRRTGGGSGTSGGGRRAGRRTGWPVPASPASPCRRCWPVTASHSGPLSRSRMEVLRAGSCGPGRAGAARTSSTR